MKILIGLIYYAENEYKDCIKSINNQTYKKWDLFEVKNLPKKEAHHKLYSAFMSKSSDYDLFLKIDADMVLARSTLFEEIVSETGKNNNINHFEFKLLDNFTNSLIFGLHVYRSTVRWEFGDEVYFTDRTNYDTSYKRYVDESDPCVPAAIHSPNPSILQSFHFGVHKMVKVMQEGVSTPDLNSSIVHLRNIYLTNKNYLKTSNSTLAYALLGAFWALNQRAGHKEANYDSEVTGSALSMYKMLPYEKIEKEVLTINNRFFLRLPFSIWKVYMIIRIHKFKNYSWWFFKKLHQRYLNKVN